jgi:hypothetical protein
MKDWTLPNHPVSQANKVRPPRRLGAPMHKCVGPLATQWQLIGMII